MPSNNPLIKPESTHYKRCDMESVEMMEKIFGLEDMKIWAKVTACKYRLRIGDKDAIEKEVTKIKDYEAYYLYLKEQIKLKESVLNESGECSNHPNGLRPTVIVVDELENQDKKESK